MFRTAGRNTVIALAACFVSATASAQSSGAAAPDTSVTATATAQPAGPRLDVTATAVRNVSQAPETTLLQRSQPMSMGKPMAMMIVGGAAIVLGAVIGGDIGTLFMIGGSVSVLIGLYQYLK